MLKDYNFIRKADLYYFVAILIFFTTVITINMRDTWYNRYVFTPDFEIYRVEYMDMIDSTPKLERILKSSLVYKEFVPREGDFVTDVQGNFIVLRQEDIIFNNKIVKLKYNSYLEWKEEYVFRVNTITISSNPLFVELIKDDEMLSKVIKWGLENENIFLSSEIKVGDYLWYNTDGKLEVIKKSDLTDISIIKPYVNKNLEK